MTQQNEAKFMNEWLLLKHPEALQWKRVRLGPLPKKKLSKMYKVTQRWVDAIFYEDEIVHLVEAKLKPKPGAIAQLELYRKLFPKTPKFTLFRNKQIKCIMLTTAKAPELETMAKEKQILYKVYQPKWLMEVV